MSDVIIAVIIVIFVLLFTFFTMYHGKEAKYHWHLDWDNFGFIKRLWWSFLATLMYLLMALILFAVVIAIALLINIIMGYGLY